MNKSISILVFCSFYLFGYGMMEAGENYRLQKQWGEFGDKPGEFKFPAMVAIDSFSNVYVVDQHNHRIQKFDSEGNFLLMWGSFGTDASQFKYPYGIAIDSEGDVYISDMNNHRIQKFSSDGRFIKMIGEYGTEKDQFKYPYGLAIDKNNILYIIDAFNYRIQMYNQNLENIGIWGSQEEIGIKVYMPHEITINKNGNIVLSDRQNHRLSLFTKEGKLIERWGKYGEGKYIPGGELSEPHGVATDSKGNVLVCDRYNFRIQRFNNSGEFDILWNAAGPEDDSKQFVLGIAVNNYHTVYVTDHYQHCVQVYKP